MTEFIMNNLGDIITMIVSVIVAIWAISKGKWELLKAVAFKFMFSAERLMATKEGKAKMDAVYAAVWARIPKWLKRFVSEKTLREKLQDWYNIAKNSLGGDTDESTESTT